MSGHETFFDDTAFPALTETFFGDPGTYTPFSGPVVSGVYMVFEKDVVIEPGGYNSTTVTVGDTMAVLVADVGDVSEGDIFTLNGTDYTCKKELDNNGGVTKWVVHA